MDISTLETTTLSRNAGHQLPSDATPHASRTENGVKVHGTRFLPGRSITRAHVSSERVPIHHTFIKHTLLAVFLGNLRYVKKSNLTIGDSTIIRLLNDYVNINYCSI